MPTLPENKLKWAVEVKASRLEGESIFSLRCWKSASKISRRQFLMLRVLYSKSSLANLWQDFDGNKSVSAKSRQLAMACLQGSTDFKQYLESLTAAKGCGGTFQMARLYQRRCAILKGEDGIISAPKIEVAPRHFTRSQAKRAQGSPSQSPSIDDIAGQMDDLMLSGEPHTPKKPSQKSGSGGNDDNDDSYDSDDSDDNDDDDDDDDGEDHCIYLSPFASYDSPLASQYTDSVFQVIEDEQIVNFALCLLLDSLVEQSSDVVEGGHWTPTRSPFKVKDGKNDVYQARVDGVFRRAGQKLADMIVEVKPNSREKGGPAVDMQESAQMAAWIATLARGTEATAQKESGPEPTAAKVGQIKRQAGLAKGKNYRRVLISQNRNRIFVTVASFDDAYVDYISGIGRSYQGTDGPFLKMRRYGSADVSDSGDMKRMCVFLLSLAI